MKQGLSLIAIGAALAFGAACSSDKSPSGDTSSGGSDGASGGSSGSNASGGDTSSSGGAVSASGGATSSGGTGSSAGGGLGSGGTPVSGGGTTSSGGTTASGSGGASTGGKAGTDADSGAALGPYPSGPYGNKVGDILPNFPLQGYVNTKGDVISNTLPFVDSYSMDDVRRTGKPYVLIHVSDFVCPGCQHAARQLAVDGKGILDAGGAALDILSADFGATSTKAELDAWDTSASLNVSSFIDGPSDPMGAVKYTGIRETAIIVSMPDMKVVWILNGDVSGLTPPSIVAATAEMHKLLGK
jgi:hypothetical protein